MNLSIRNSGWTRPFAVKVLGAWLAVCSFATGPSQAAPAAKPDRGSLTVVVTGDSIGPYKPLLRHEDRRLDEIVEILKQADGAFGNQEGSIFDVGSFSGTLGAENGGGVPLGTQAVASDFKAMGLNMMSKANNHAVDFGLEGLRASEQALTVAGVVHAGSGPDEASARRPAYLETSKGKIALVATATTFPEMSPAGALAQVDGVGLRGRPGISALRLTQTIFVTQQEMDVLRTMGARRAGSTSPAIGTDGKPADLTIFDLHSGQQTYRVSETPKLHYEMDQGDLGQLLDSVRSADQNAELVVFSIHAHETASGANDDPEPADFLPSLFHQAIDAGADIVVRHGPHSLKGIEIYKGKPIFYGMASFFNGLGDANRKFRGRILIPISWDDGIVAEIRMDKGRLASVRLYPIMTIREQGPLLGAPRRTTHAEAERILRDLQTMSAIYGTRIQIDKGVGVIDLPTHGD